MSEYLSCGYPAGASSNDPRNFPMIATFSLFVGEGMRCAIVSMQSLNSFVCLLSICHQNAYNHCSTLHQAAFLQETIRAEVP
jgi:hypothetical protein